MIHRKLVEPALQNLEGERAEYFARVMQRLDEDKRVEAMPNLVYLCLKECIPYLPIYLPAPELVNALLGFVGENQQRLNRAIFDRRFVEDPDSPEGLKSITNEFVAKVLQTVLERFDDGQVNVEERKVYKFSYPYGGDDFPYKDLDED